MNKLIIISLFVFLLIGVIFNMVSVITYSLDVDNCEQLISHNNLATNDDTIRCIKIINQPVYSYYIPEILSGWFLSGIITFLIGSIIFFIKEVLEDFY